MLELWRTPLGRHQFWYGVRFRLWPLYSLAARIHLRTALRGTRVIAVVGSFGKTTAVRACAAALALEPDSDRGKNAWSGLARTILRVRRGERRAVFEVGIDGPGQMRGYSRLLRPDVAVVMSIGSEHHRSLATTETTRDEKAEMVRGLASDGLAVLNGDDPNVLWMQSQTRARVVTFGREAHNDVQLRDVRLEWPTGMSLRVIVGGEDRELRVKLGGAPTVYAVGAAVAVAWAEGIGLDEVAERLASLPPTPGRLEPVALPNGAWLLRDDFKASLETVDCAIDTLEEISARRKLIVMGEISEPPGSQGPIYRRIGERMAKVASRIVLVGNNFQRYAAGARRGGLASEAVIDAGRSPRAAAEAIRNMLEPGDVVLIKGRDTQRLDRVTLRLVGREVGCDIPHCDAKLRCDACPMLERGWQGRRVVI
jgi:UDP-N-acetylmuramoyl-tripeptide--D-alanyl-D-alanine ligase